MFQYIYKTADLNGYGKEFIDKIYKKYELNSLRRQATTLKRFKKDQKYISIPYFPKISNDMQRIFKTHGFQLVTRSKNNLKSMLCNYKDPEKTDSKSGIYKFECEDCCYVYIGQTRRKFEVRRREHVTAIKTEKKEKSAIAEHMLEQNHKFDPGKGKLIMNVRQEFKLNPWESFFITTEPSPLMNRCEPPIVSRLFNLSMINL